MTLRVVCLLTVTALPLLTFGATATRIPLSMVGLLQYIAPVMQFLLGVLVFREQMGTSRRRNNPLSPARASNHIRRGKGRRYEEAVYVEFEGLLAIIGTG